MAKKDSTPRTPLMDALDRVPYSEVEADVVRRLRAAGVDADASAARGLAQGEWILKLARATAATAALRASRDTSALQERRRAMIDADARLRERLRPDVLRMREQGKTQQAIANVLSRRIGRNVSRTTVRKILAEGGIVPRPRRK